MMMRIWLIGMLLSASAWAEDVTVIYFGGYAATSGNIACWKRTAESRLSGVHATGFAWPSGAPSAPVSAVVRAGQRQINDALRLIEEEVRKHPDRKIILAGHSSGAALSNQVARLTKYPHQVDLVNLDGFAPEKSLQNRMRKSTCWYAHNTRIYSRNAGSMRSACGANARAYKHMTCNTAWCLHFALVNTGVPGNLGGVSGGYNNCNANIEWMKSFAPPRESSAAPMTTASSSSSEAAGQFILDIRTTR